MNSARSRDNSRARPARVRYSLRTLMMLVPIVAIGVWYFTPKSATPARLLVRPQSLLTGNMWTPEEYDAFVEDRTALIKGPLVLPSVLRYPNEVPKDVKDSITWLSDRLSLTRVEESTEIEILLKHHDPQTAASLTNAIVRAFVDQTRLADSLLLQDECVRIEREIVKLRGEPVTPSVEIQVAKLTRRLAELERMHVQQTPATVTVLELSKP